MSGFAIKAIIVLVAIMLILVFIARFVRRVSPAKSVSLRQRMPVFVALFGGALLAIGFVLALSSFVSRYTAELLVMRIAAVVTFVAGACVVIAYRNLYIEAGARELRFRTVFGREKHIAYDDIASHNRSRFLGEPRITVRSRSGVKFSANPARYNLSAMTAALDRVQ